MPKMNWEKETSGGNVVYPAGTYHVRVTGFERVTAKTGTEQIRWKAEIVAPEEHRGRSILEHTALTDAALWRTANFVKACSVDTSECPVMDTSGPGFDVILNNCKERKMFWHVQEEIGQNGNPRNKIVDYQPDPDEIVFKITKDNLNADDVAWED